MTQLTPNNNPISPGFQAVAAQEHLVDADAVKRQKAYIGDAYIPDTFPNFFTKQLSHGWTAYNEAGGAVKAHDAVSIEDFASIRSKIVSKNKSGIIIVAEQPGLASTSACYKAEAILDFAGWYALIPKGTKEIFCINVTANDRPSDIDNAFDVVKSACIQKNAYLLYSELRMNPASVASYGTIMQQEDITFAIHAMETAGLYRPTRLPKVISAAPTQSALNKGKFFMPQARKQALYGQCLLVLIGKILDRMAFVAGKGKADSMCNFVDRFGDGCLYLPHDVIQLACDFADEDTAQLATGFIERNFSYSWITPQEQMTLQTIENFLAGFDRALDVWEAIVFPQAKSTGGITRRSLWGTLANDEQRNALFCAGKQMGADAFLKAALVHKIPLDDLLAGQTHR